MKSCKRDLNSYEVEEVQNSRKGSVHQSFLGSMIFQSVDDIVKKKPKYILSWCTLNIYAIWATINKFFFPLIFHTVKERMTEDDIFD